MPIEVGAAGTKQYRADQHHAHSDRHAPPDINLNCGRPTRRSGSRDGLRGSTALSAVRLQPRNISLQLKESRRLPLAETFVPQEISRKQLLRAVKPIEVNIRERAEPLAVAATDTTLVQLPWVSPNSRSETYSSRIESGER